MSEGTKNKDILDRLVDLHRQATTERSHYYTGCVVTDAANEIMRLRLACRPDDAGKAETAFETRYTRAQVNAMHQADRQGYEQTIDTLRRELAEANQRAFDAINRCKQSHHACTQAALDEALAQRNAALAKAGALRIEVGEHEEMALIREHRVEEARAERDAALAEVERLPGNLREVFLLRYVAGRSCAEVAGELSVPLGTVTSRLSRGHRILRERLKRGKERP
jgi:hypothetical protein